MPILKNARYEIFAMAVARGESAHTAYTLAGYKQHRQNAARLMTNDDIKARVKEVQMAATLDTMLTIRQKREYLARIVRARVSELTDDSDLWQVTITADGVKRTLPDKLRAIALDNELSGEGAQENREDVTVVVRIGGSDTDEASFIPDRSPVQRDGESGVHSGGQ